MSKYVLLVFLLFSAFSGAADDIPPEPFEALYERGRMMEKSLGSFRARFTETTTSTLLVEPIVARGTMVGARPIRLLIRYDSPEKKDILVDGNRLLVAWPETGEHHGFNIGRTQKAVDKYFTRASVKELRGHFDIEVLLDPEHPGTYRVDMSPKRKRIKKGLSRLQLWLNQESLIMERMLMTFPGGETKLIELEDIEVNVDIGEDTFDQPLVGPEDSPS